MTAGTPACLLGAGNVPFWMPAQPAAVSAGGVVALLLVLTLGLLVFAEGFAYGWRAVAAAQRKAQLTLVRRAHRRPTGPLRKAKPPPLQALGSSASNAGTR